MATQQKHKKQLSDIHEVNESQSNDQVSEFKGRYSNVIYDLQQRQNYVRPRVDVNNKSRKNKADLEMKIIMIGESNTGKTSLMLRFTDNVFFRGDQTSTIGVDIKVKTVKIDGNNLKLQIWDTAGQEKFQSLQQNYFRGSHGCIAVYDITNRQSYEYMKQSLKEYLEKNCTDSNEIVREDKSCNSVQPKKSSVMLQNEYRPPHNIVLVGTKLDLSKGNQRKVNYIEALNFAKNSNLGGFIETSSKQSQLIEDVNDIFRVLSILHFESLDESLQINQIHSANAKIPVPLSVKKKISQNHEKADDESSIFKESSAYSSSIASSDARKLRQIWDQKRKEDEENKNKCC